MIYFATSLALHVSLTMLIVGRLLKCKMQAQGILVDSYGKHHDLISVLFVESALMNAACSAVLLAIFPFGRVPRFNMTFVVCFAVTPAVLLSLCSLYPNNLLCFQACANYLIIYPRRIRGRRWAWIHLLYTACIPRLKKITGFIHFPYIRR